MKGDMRVDILMIPVLRALEKHVKDEDAKTEIYNRAYEAVIISMEAKEAERNKLAEAVGLMTTLKPTMVVDSAHPVEMALEVSEYIAQLTTERDEWRAVAPKLMLNDICQFDYDGITRCRYCGTELFTVDQCLTGHSPDCPIRLYMELCEKYDIEKPAEGDDITG